MYRHCNGSCKRRIRRPSSPMADPPFLKTSHRSLRRVHTCHTVSNLKSAPVAAWAFLLPVKTSTTLRPYTASRVRSSSLRGFRPQGQPFPCRNSGKHDNGADLCAFSGMCAGGRNAGKAFSSFRQILSRSASSARSSKTELEPGRTSRTPSVPRKTVSAVSRSRPESDDADAPGPPSHVRGMIASFPPLDIFAYLKINFFFLTESLTQVFWANGVSPCVRVSHDGKQRYACLNRKNFAPPVDARLFLVVHRNQAGFSPFSTAFWHGHSFGNENRLFLVLKFIFK